MSEERIILAYLNNESDTNFEKLNETRNKMIQSIAENMDLYGITDSIGRLYGTLYFSNHPLTLDEMQDALGMSKTSMSTGVRTLLEAKMVRKVWRKGERKDLYITEKDWYKSFFDHFSTKWIDAIEANLKVMIEAEKEYLDLIGADASSSIHEEIKMDLLKLDEIRAYYDWLKRLIDTFETGKIFELVPKK